MKITIKSKKSRVIEESIEISDETTSKTTLKTLRVFLLKTFRHFPVNFNFETPQGFIFDVSEECFVTINRIYTTTLFVSPYISSGTKK